eukprot:TRINITY_DN470_c0_g1_i2.p1 TRINITY_DN470_c0_g1~~TRINITY_DN470_c0_g1_i2.p1  ORF type:complete len:504 (-),score=78.32 TRINITY_DN470_c0_g1_i2:25-1536(-)
MAKVAAHWFRKGLRVHDNPALLEACNGSSHVYPIFVIDPAFACPSTVGVLRYHFLLDSLKDLDSSLRTLGSRLYILRGNPIDVLPQQLSAWGVQLLTLEADTEPYARKRDARILADLESTGVSVRAHHSHTLWELDHYVQSAGKSGIPKSYGGFCKLFEKLGTPRAPEERPTSVPSSQAEDLSCWMLPTALEMGYPEVTSPMIQKYPGGETEALRRLKESVTERAAWVRQFEKPKTSPNSLEPATTVLSPYLKFGCLSAAVFWKELTEIYSGQKHTSPPVSLGGQLLWREYNYTVAYTTLHFDRMKGNSNCKQIPWENDNEKLDAWENAQTGYPFIDAIMTQLAQEGWVHHLARHAVACFLTRGDLWQSWEAGARVFDKLLLDADWSINNFNWQWLSCSAHFYQYFRCYSPVAFGKKTDPTGAYIKKYIPALRNMPTKFVYEPWLAPETVQLKAGCVVGQDYPHRIVIDHTVTSKENMNKMKAAYDLGKSSEKVSSKRKADEL